MLTTSYRRSFYTSLILAFLQTLVFSSFVSVLDFSVFIAQRPTTVTWKQTILVISSMLIFLFSKTIFQRKKIPFQGIFICFLVSNIFFCYSICMGKKDIFYFTPGRFFLLKRLHIRLEFLLLIAGSITSSLIHSSLYKNAYSEIRYKYENGLLAIIRLSIKKTANIIRILAVAPVISDMLFLSLYFIFFSYIISFLGLLLRFQIDSPGTFSIIHFIFSVCISNGLYFSLVNIIDAIEIYCRSSIDTSEILFYRNKEGNFAYCKEPSHMDISYTGETSSFDISYNENYRFYGDTELETPESILSNLSSCDGEDTILTTKRISRSFGGFNGKNNTWNEKEIERIPQYKQKKTRNTKGKILFSCICTYARNLKKWMENLIGVLCECIDAIEYLRNLIDQGSMSGSTEYRRYYLHQVNILYRKNRGIDFEEYPYIGTQIEEYIREEIRCIKRTIKEIKKENNEYTVQMEGQMKEPLGRYIEYLTIRSPILILYIIVMNRWRMFILLEKYNTQYTIFADILELFEEIKRNNVLEEIVVKDLQGLWEDFKYLKELCIDVETEKLNSILKRLLK